MTCFIQLSGFAKNNLQTLCAYLNQLPNEYANQSERETIENAVENGDLQTIQQHLNAIDNRIDACYGIQYNHVADAILAVMQSSLDIVKDIAIKDAYRTLNTILVMLGNKIDDRFAIAILKICSCIEKNTLQQALTRTSKLYREITDYTPGSQYYDYLTGTDIRTRETITAKLLDVRNTLTLLPRN